MRYSELGGKEIIDLDNGERIGVVGQSDLVIDPKTGAILSMIIPVGSFLALGRKKRRGYDSVEVDSHDWERKNYY